MGLWKPLSAKYREPLEKHFTYYRTLSPSQQRVFRHRLALFIKAKKFVSRGGLHEVSSEMKSMIGATAVMLTMGFQLITFTSFKRIIVYPTDYYSKINRRYHKGEVNLRFGLIILSWEHVVRGMADRKDGISLGIHELAHALHLEDRMRNREHNYLHTGLLRYWKEHALWEMQKIANGDDHLFRPYAATNEEEFFAVAMENFFERPAAFKEDLPELYRIMTILLKQDPAVGTILP